ncbi:YjhX family toxin [Ruegeria conchae]|uniref:YjhX family toxin n=1 Tax=Ruegeria conchae TaxID=981384 RepID=UPI00147D435C|nr:YjhX family toxin [Ruegeria conchae]UWR02871.1 YjhX family toxin [Ruegeria conchae]
MNISITEQRVLRMLAQGGTIRHERNPNGKIVHVVCNTIDRSLLSDCTLDIIGILRRKRLTVSRNSGSNSITAIGRRSVGRQLNNRTA